MVAGVDYAAFTKLDVLDKLEKIGICVAYKLDGQIIESPPARSEDMLRAEPQIEWFPGWQRSTKNARSWNELPENAKRYLQRLAELIDCKIGLVSVGPKRSQTFFAN